MKGLIGASEMQVGEAEGCLWLCILGLDYAYSVSG